MDKGATPIVTDTDPKKGSFVVFNPRTSQYELYAMTGQGPRGLDQVCPPRFHQRTDSTRAETATLGYVLGIVF